MNIDKKKRHEAFRAYYWEEQTKTIFKISLVFLLFCTICFFVVVPFEHAKYPDLGRLKYGTSIIGHILVAIFAKWLLMTKKISENKKAIISERFTFFIGLGYLLWGLFGMEISILEYSTPVILMYLILLATITAFLYYPLYYYVALIIISYTVAGICCPGGNCHLLLSRADGLFWLVLFKIWSETFEPGIS